MCVGGRGGGGGEREREREGKECLQIKEQNKAELFNLLKNVIKGHFHEQRGGGGGDYTIFLRNLHIFFVPVITFFPFFCENNYYTSLLLIVCALR